MSIDAALLIFGIWLVLAAVLAFPLGKLLASRGEDCDQEDADERERASWR